MSIPTAVFLDTSILDGQQYNFESTALSTFVPVCKERGLTLLLPEPTEKEIERHIRQRSSDALAALADARRKAPFLAKWPGLPPPSAKSESVERLQVYAIARREWEAFLKQFNVVKLGYEDLDVKKVMLWYEMTTAPFREGKKAQGVSRCVLHRDARGVRGEGEAARGGCLRGPGLQGGVPAV